MTVPVAEKTFFLPLNALGTLVENYLTHASISELYNSILLVSTFFLCRYHCLDYHCFEVCFVIRKYKSSHSVLLLQGYFGYSALAFILDAK